MDSIQGKYLIRLNIADCITLGGVIFSWVALLLALLDQYYLSVSVLFIAMLGDALDGILARKMGIIRPFGRYLDGFMDMLIYLIAPSLVLYQAGFDGYWSILLPLFIACGCIRLSVFNDIGNISQGNHLAYLGMPVFWSIFIVAGFFIGRIWLPPIWLNILMTLTLLWFSHAMLYRQPRFKFKKLWQILLLTLGGAGVFGVLHLILDSGSLY